MKLRNKLKLAAISTIIVSSTLSFSGVKAVQIGETAIEQNQVVAVAIPGGRFYNLAVIEQIPGKQDCWREIGSQPTVIDPLWTTFDFTGSCRRATDTNGYSVRLDGQDTSQDYRLEVLETEGEVQLIAVSRQDRSRTVIGKTFGQAEGEFLKIYLNPGWEFTKKTVDDQMVGHFYFSGDTAAIAAAGDNPPIPVAASSFVDTKGDIYQEEIEQAVALGFIAGFNDSTFRPEESLTREQIVSMVIGAMETVPDVQVQAPETTTTQPYFDVAASRWSAAKIQWAKDNQIVKGYPDGSFRPEQPVTRAELMAVLENAARYVNAQRGASPELELSGTPTDFVDTSGHWGQSLISKMSAYCDVASAYNEQGQSFFPDNPSSRNYAAAATVRMQQCLVDSSQQANN
ncbi:MAG TPA: DUF3747 domain-containing protein [Xenococcaceae cyanobacterium]